MKNIQEVIKTGRRKLREITDVIRGDYKTPDTELKITTTRNGDHSYNHRLTLDGKLAQEIIGTQIVRTYIAMNEKQLNLDPSLEETFVVYVIPGKSKLRFRK